MSSTAAASSSFYQSSRFWILVAVALVVLQASVLYVMGRIPICECGYVKLWEGGVNSSGNSQHLADWYTPSHIIHGFLLYSLAWLLLRSAPLTARLSFAVFIEAGWEILENTPMVIDRYRTATMALGYTGDSILNSTMDTIFMSSGFLLASRLPIRVTVLIGIGFEFLTGWIIRDNLTLNVLMLAWPIDAVRDWQAAL